jgi:hypothetical protein
MLSIWKSIRIILLKESWQGVCWQISTRDEIATALKKSKTLDRKTNHFCSEYFDIPLNELRASSFTVDLNRYGLLKKSFTLE